MVLPILAVAGKALLGSVASKAAGNLAGGKGSESKQTSGEQEKGSLLKRETKADGTTIEIFAPPQQKVASKSSGGGLGKVLDPLGLLGGIAGGGDKGGGLLKGLLG